MTDRFEFITLKGKGIFMSGNCQIESNFTLKRQFSHTIFILQHSDSTVPFTYRPRPSDLWSLSGQLDDSRPIYAEQLMLSRVGGNYEETVELSPLAEVIIGQSISSFPLEVQYPLVGLFEGNFSIEDSGWTIEVLQSDENATIAGRRSTAWRVPLEGLTLKLSNIQKTIEEYNEKAHEIMLLLSLATGNGVTSYRQIAGWGGQGVKEIWQKMTGDELGPGPIVPAFRLEQFLKQTLPVWKEWASDKKIVAQLGITYINLSATGYIDTRLFQVYQAWELLASSWMPKGTLNDVESNLREKMKSSYREWKNEHPGVDPKGCWGSRITFPFNWPITKRQIESLADNKGIDLVKIGLDLEALKKERDSVAHTGKMKNKSTSNSRDTYQLLAAAQFGLQLLLIAELGYSGLVITLKNGWRSFVESETFFKGNGASQK